MNKLSTEHFPVITNAPKHFTTFSEEGKCPPARALRPMDTECAQKLNNFH